LDVTIELEQECSLSQRVMNLQCGANESSLLEPATLLRSGLLVAITTVGGPSERVVPSTDLDEFRVDNVPLVHSLPVPDAYRRLSNSRPAPGALWPVWAPIVSLAATKEKAPTYRRDCRAALHACCGKLASTEGTHFGAEQRLQMAETLIALLESVLQNEGAAPFETLLPSSIEVDAATFDGIQSAVNLASRYVKDLGIEIESAGHGGDARGCMSTDAFGNQLCGVLAALHKERGSAGAVQMDWFVATVHMMTRSVQTTLELCQRLARTGCSATLWMSAAVFAQGGDVFRRYVSVAHCAELLVSTRVPTVANAFKLSGFSVAEICMLWLRQCFWNFLDWHEIMQFVALCVVMEEDFQAHYCVAILRHLEPLILECVVKKNLVECIKTRPITGFRVGAHLAFLAQLAAGVTENDPSLS